MTISKLPSPLYQTPWRLYDHERHSITCADSLEDPNSCSRTLYVAFFFDGTRNNLLYDKSKMTHSNIARLYLAFDEELKAGEDHQYRYRTYVPGVGTEFWKQIGDTGVGLHNSVGAATGWGGEARINWALLQLQNHLHLYATGKKLTEENEDRALVQQMSTDISLPTMQLPFSKEAPPPVPQSDEDIALRRKVWFNEVAEAVAHMQWRGSNIDGRRRVLAQRRGLLRKKLTPLLTGKLPRIARIRLSVFGFSRGAAEARVFVNWLRDLCDNAKGPMHICGVPTQVDFLGLFDTVASVGAAQSVLEDIATGHGGWARARDLRIPGPQVVARCLHLVAGHEVRGSFPLDAASGGNVEEVIYPGVHSDLGGGYRPGEQGRSLTDSDKLSQIPLCHMYRAAVAAGVPLLDLDQAAAPLREQFLVSEALTTRFNTYMAEMKKLVPKGGDTRALVREHYRLYLRWRRHCLGRLAELPAVKRSTRQDRTDLLEADAELLLEWKDLASTDKKVASLDSIRNSAFGQHGYTGMAMDFGGWIASWHPIVQIPKKVLGEFKYIQWKQVRETWDQGGPLPAAVHTLFAEDVHDSRAWFKPFGDDDDVWDSISRERLQYLMDKEQAATAPRRRINPRARPVPSPQLTDSERRELDDYRKHLAGRSPASLPADALPGQREGREPSLYWGYLRWRTVYEDVLMDYRAQHPDLAEATPEVLKARQRALERESEQLIARAEELDKQLNAVAMSGGSGAYFPEFNERGAIYQRQQEIAIELKAIEEFLNELGPEPWWSLF